jgi:hypothetical protein
MILNKSYVFPLQKFNAAIETSGNSTNVPIRFIIAIANIKTFSRYNKSLFFKNIQIKTELAVNEIKKKFIKCIINSGNTEQSIEGTNELFVKFSAIFSLIKIFFHFQYYIYI